ncbi:hypothetical protein D3C85_681010 [compost metagenome]
MKHAICRTMDYLFYLSFALVFLFSFLTFIGGEILGAIIFLVIGWIVCCLFSAFWFVASSANEALQTQTKILADISKRLKNVENNINTNWVD